MAEESGEPPPVREEKPAVSVEPPEPASIDRSATYSGAGYSESHSRPRWPTVVIVTAVVFLVAIIVVAVSKRLNRMDDDSGRTAQQPVASRPNPSPAQGSEPAGAKNPGQAPQEAAKPPDSGHDIAQLGPGQSITVRLEATTGDSWVRYQVDEDKSGTVILKPGEGKDLPTAREQVKLHLGNRKTLKLKINNREATFPSTTPNFAAQVIISRENLRTYFQ